MHSLYFLISRILISAARRSRFHSPSGTRGCVTSAKEGVSLYLCLDQSQQGRHLLCEASNKWGPKKKKEKQQRNDPSLAMYKILSNFSSLTKMCSVNYYTEKKQWHRESKNDWQTGKINRMAMIYSWLEGKTSFRHHWIISGEPYIIHIKNMDSGRKSRRRQDFLAAFATQGGWVFIMITCFRKVNLLKQPHLDVERQNVHAALPSRLPSRAARRFAYWPAC